MKNRLKKIGAYFKDRITKREVSTILGIALVVAGPLGWATMEQVALIKTVLTMSGAIDPAEGAGLAAAVGAVLVAVKEKK